MVALVFAAESTSGGTSQLVVTIIAAVAALAGAVIGGLITAVGTYRIEEKKQKFQREQDEQRRREEEEHARRAAAATARAMHTGYIIVSAYLLTAVNTRQWWTNEAPVWPRPSHSEMKTIAPFLSPREWLDIEDAHTVLTLGWEISQQQPNQQLTEQQKQKFLDWIKSINAARAAVAKLAGLPALSLEEELALLKADVERATE